MEDNSVFESDADFCSNCGAILKLDHIKMAVECVVCENNTTLKKMIGVKNYYSIDFTPLEYHSQAKAEKKKKLKTEDDSVGQMENDRECSKCDHKGMSYTTMQLRSADEGQTIFYFCPQCKNREVEES